MSTVAIDDASRRRALFASTLGVAAVVALIPVSRTNYLLFHTLLELLTTSIAFGGFVVAWNTRDIAENRYTAKLGIGLAFVGLVTLLHAIAYRGMGVFPDVGANLPTQLWILSRALLAGAFAVAGLSLYVRVAPVFAWAGFATATVLGLVSIFVKWGFPVMFVEGSGLTPIKIWLEYAIMVVMVISGILLWRGRASFGGRVVNMMLAGLIAMIAAELSFTLYVDVYGFFNFLGHVLTLIGFMLLYAAIIDTGLRRPTSLLFHDLEQREQSERAAAASLERANLRLRVLVADLEATNRRLDEATNAKGEFLRNVSHELRTPLNSIIGFSEILSRGMAGPLNEEQSRQLEMIHAAGAHLLELVEELLDLSRIEEGRLHLTLTDFDAREIAATAIAMVRPMADEKQIELSCGLPENTVMIHSDAVRVEQILLNLLGNAVKYTEAGRIRLDVTADDDWVDFGVTDTGIGIPADGLQACFEVFYRAGEPTEKGSGLGLPVSKHLASALGGDILAQSEPGSGSVFTLRLPSMAEETA